jgi:polyhydroxyalkanoate depolymerase
MHRNTPRRKKQKPGADFARWLLYWPAAFIAAGGQAIDPYKGNASERDSATGADGPQHDNRWATPNRICLELGTMRLRDFSQSTGGRGTLVCAPYALHRATIADFAPGHSLVEALLRNGIARLHVTDWRSATPDMQHFAIDNYLADLNVAVDELGPPVDLIGLCQGGWLALAFAARFPQKVRCLVLAGAPVDIAAAESRIGNVATSTPMAIYEELVRAGGGRVLGQRMLQLWSAAPSSREARAILQIADDTDWGATEDLLRRFRDWHRETVDLPGKYYLQVVTWIFKENRLAEGRFAALGRRIDLAAIHHPICLLAGRDDDLVAVGQILGATRHIATPKSEIKSIIEPCGHHSLFLGANTLRQAWPRIARWLAGNHDIRQAA